MKITINQQQIEVNPGVTILEAARQHGINIPTLCYHEAFGGQGMCRLCMVEIKTPHSSKVVAACTYPVQSEIEVLTSTPEIEIGRRTIVALLHRSAAGSEYMQKMCEDYQCPEFSLSVNLSERCILCRLCVRACDEIGSSAISAVWRGTDKRIGTPFDEPSAVCIGCGACAAICPTEAIPVKQTREERTIWNRTFAMASCQSCGQSFATREQLDYITAKTGLAGLELEVCEACRKKNLAAKIEQFAR